MIVRCPVWLLSVPAVISMVNNQDCKMSRLDLVHAVISVVSNHDSKMSRVALESLQ